jgi:multidrug efflux pump
MRFTDVFIRRPVFAASLSLLIFLIGLIAYGSLTLRQFPKMTANVISIDTTYTGASASTVESFVTTQIENAIAGVDNIDYITSESSAGDSKVTINLNLNSDVNAALEDVNSDLSSILKNLPDGVDSPVVKKLDTDGMPMLILSFSSSSRSPEAVTDYLNRVIIPQLSTVSGVGSAEVMGKRTYAMRLWLDPKKMTALGITADDIEDALNNNNIQAQPGDIDRESQVLTINVSTTVSTVTAFENIPLKSASGSLVKIKDVARVELGAEDYDESMYVNGEQGVGVGITAKSDANPLTVSVDVHAVLDTLKKQMPSDITMILARDSSVYIEKSIEEVLHTIAEASIFVIIVIFLFIGSLRSVLIPIVTIPLSLVGAFGLMFMLGYTINTITLLAFVLAIGMVVDDAIVVLENIHRYIEQGLTPYEAAIQGAREISVAVIAMTLTLAAVYAPIGFMSGFTSILFSEFAFTLAGTVIVSGFIALTLSPMMCSKIMKPSGQGSKLVVYIDQTLNRLTSMYRACLVHVLSARLAVIAVLVGVLVLGVVFIIPLEQKSILAPTEDQSVIVGMARAPTGSSVAYTQKYTKMLAPIYAKVPEHDKYVIINGHPGGQENAMTVLGLKDWSERTRTADQILEQVTQQSSVVPGVQLMFFNPSSLPGSQAIYPVQFVIKTTGSYESLNATATKIVRALEEKNGILRVQSDLQLDKPELQLDVNRNKAASLGVSMADINTALNVGLGEPEITSFDKEGQTYNVITQLDAEHRLNPSQLNNLNVRSSSGALVPLSSFVTIKNITSPSSLNHFAEQRAATINVVLSPGYSEQEAIDYFVVEAKKYMSTDMSYDFAGDTREFMQSSNSMLKIFLFSLIFIYLILSAQFESFVDPLIVLFSVPLSIVGALITVYFTGCSLNIYTEIGLVTLVGLISKHGILIVEFANQLQAKGRDLKQAVVEAASIRLRPILMTTAAMVLGAVPLAFASGAGAESRHQIGVVIIGGMLVGTLFTLFIVPTMYTLMSRRTSTAPPAELFDDARNKSEEL